MLKNVILKKISLAAAIIALTATAAVAEVVSPVGFGFANSNKPQITLNGSSTLVVNIEVECERTEVGIYARYAQKLFGVRAPLVEKENYTILSADLALAPNDFYVATNDMMQGDSSEQLSTTTTPLPIDLKSSDLLSGEEAAEEAANAIFEIRQLRRDLIAGELGEGFYGAGLTASLDRLQWEEEQYAELFFGRTIRSRSTHTQFVALDGTTPRYIVGRFSDKSGLCDATDLAAEPIILQLTPCEPREIAVPAIEEKSTIVKFWVENSAVCELFFGSKSLSNKKIPLTEFGQEVLYPINAK
ncbi:MAG: DUF4831 family protein [Rikenellaceae bacterium]